ncbi:MAG TPA: hypothetical protein VLM76_14885, partial [Patescibacteria group bacterium]|nr:hypothetical protein [Patescibacteria group bacterium]
MSIECAFVAGAGLMGNGIRQVLATAGRTRRGHGRCRRSVILAAQLLSDSVSAASRLGAFGPG